MFDGGTLRSIFILLPLIRCVYVALYLLKWSQPPPALTSYSREAVTDMTYIRAVSGVPASIGRRMGFRSTAVVVGIDLGTGRKLSR